MADIELPDTVVPIVPSAPVRPAGGGADESPRRRPPSKRPRRDEGLTDDQGEGRDEPPLVDDYA